LRAPLEERGQLAVGGNAARLVAIEIGELGDASVASRRLRLPADTAPVSSSSGRSV
jgi:hypothetical protein